MKITHKRDHDFIPDVSLENAKKGHIATIEGIKRALPNWEQRIMPEMANHKHSKPYLVEIKPNEYHYYPIFETVIYIEYDKECFKDYLGGIPTDGWYANDLRIRDEVIAAIYEYEE